MHARVLVQGQRGVAGDHRRLRDRGDPGHAKARRHAALVHDPGGRERRVLLVQRDHPAAQALVLKRLAEHPGRDHRPAVVGEAERAGVAELGHLGELVAVQAPGYRGQEADLDARLATRGPRQRAQHRGVVDHGRSVGHRDHRAEAAGRRRRGAAVDVLLVLLTGGAQMDVRIDERREQVLSGRVHGLAAGWRLEPSGRPELGDLALPDQHVARFVEASSRVEHVGGADEHLGRGGVALEHAQMLGAHATATSIGESTSSS